MILMSRYHTLLLRRIIFLYNKIWYPNLKLILPKLLVQGSLVAMEVKVCPMGWNYFLKQFFQIGLHLEAIIPCKIVLENIWSKGA